MILVVDAYNVLKQALGSKTVSESAKEQFINRLSVYAQNKGHAIILVFDGGPYEWPNKERVKGIYVVYSGINESADAWIKDYVTRYKMNDILLISTDRELGSFAARLNIQSMDALDFYNLLRQALHVESANSRVKNQKATKVTEVDQPELDEIMHQASKSVPSKSDDIVQDRESKAQRLSKKERKMIQKIKKL